MVIGRLSIEWDWEVIALPMCFAHGWGQTIFRVGPICFYWMSEWERDLRKSAAER
jgi:hypothetical protein